MRSRISMYAAIQIGGRDARRRRPIDLFRNQGSVTVTDIVQENKRTLIQRDATAFRDHAQVRLPASTRVYHLCEWLQPSGVNVRSGIHPSNLEVSDVFRLYMKVLTSGSESSTRVLSISIASQTPTSSSYVNATQKSIRYANDTHASWHEHSS